MPTLLEKRILNFIHAFIIKHGHSPTLVEIGKAVEINSKGTIHRYVQNLRNKGMLAPPERGQNQEEINLSEMFVGKDRYALQIKGDSMIDIGILDGDIVIIEPRSTAEFGDIIVALIDNEDATLKRFKKLKNGRIELSPENQDLQPMIYDAVRVKIQGILVGQLRSY